MPVLLSTLLCMYHDKQMYINEKLLYRYRFYVMEKSFDDLAFNELCVKQAHNALLCVQFPLTILEQQGQIFCFRTTLR